MWPIERYNKNRVTAHTRPPAHPAPPPTGDAVRVGHKAVGEGDVAVLHAAQRNLVLPAGT